MWTAKRIVPALFLSALCACTTQQPPTCRWAIPEALMRPPRALRSLPSPQPSPATTPPATKTPSS
ncbi:gp31 [Burkholderia phage KS5]|uniref:LysC n=2 Tax=Kisquinquevirus TaxID=2732983 RepID=A0A9E7MNB0_9CAUD|nr:gp31 [Burkholderia phage KS5]ADP02278.1 gp31 [Burkholderia phage KS5]USM11620.1 LysC [Burkholderia phage Carl1]